MHISTPADWEAAQEVFDGFHDAVVRSLVFVNDHRVRSDAAMEWSGEPALRAIVQTQSRDHPGVSLFPRRLQHHVREPNRCSARRGSDD
jgi:hypothetical protein